MIVARLLRKPSFLGRFRWTISSRMFWIAAVAVTGGAIRNPVLLLLLCGLAFSFLAVTLLIGFFRLVFRAPPEPPDDEIL